MMRKSLIALILFGSIIGITAIGFGSYIIFDGGAKYVETPINPDNISVELKNFKTITFNRLTNKIECRDNLVLNDTMQIELNFDGDFYFDISNIDNSQTDRGALSFKIQVQSSNLYNHLKTIVSRDFISFQYGDYYLNYLKKNHTNSPKYFNFGVLQECFTYDDTNKIIEFTIPISKDYSENKDFYIYKIGVDNNLGDSNFTFKVNFDFNVVTSDNQMLTGFSVNDFNGINLEISGVSLSEN